MNELIPSGFHDSAFLPPLSVRSHHRVASDWDVPPRKPSTKDSIYAGGFLLVYLVAYLAAGRAGIALIEWTWVAIFRSMR